MPRVAAMIVAVVQAIPLVVNTRLYGAAAPVSRLGEIAPDGLAELARR